MISNWCHSRFAGAQPPLRKKNGKSLYCLRGRTISRRIYIPNDSPSDSNDSYSSFSLVGRCLKQDSKKNQGSWVSVKVLDLKFVSSCILSADTPVQLIAIIKAHGVQPGCRIKVGCTADSGCASTPATPINACAPAWSSLPAASAGPVCERNLKHAAVNSSQQGAWHAWGPGSPITGGHAQLRAWAAALSAFIQTGLWERRR